MTCRLHKGATKEREGPSECTSVFVDVTHCNTLQYPGKKKKKPLSRRHEDAATEREGRGRFTSVVVDIIHCNTLQHIATHRNTLQHTASYCNKLQQSATPKKDGGERETKKIIGADAIKELLKRERHTATHCSILQHKRHCQE